jgi:hypothetical protein
VDEDSDKVNVLKENIRKGDGKTVLTRAIFQEHNPQVWRSTNRPFGITKVSLLVI